VKRSELMMVVLVGMAVLISSVVVVKTKHENRRLVTELADMRGERERLETEWSQLQLEEATLANHGRVEQIAHEKLSMMAPKDTAIVEAR
jgi:cell division protein FtsL